MAAGPERASLLYFCSCSWRQHEDYWENMQNTITIIWCMPQPGGDWRFVLLWENLYSFGLLAMPIALPFAGTIGIYMDTMALGLLFCSAVEARRIDASICKDCRIRDLYENDHVEISEAEYGGGQGLPYLVQVRSGETAYECIAEEEPQFNVLVLMLFAKKGNWLLILEKDDETDKWHDVEDEEIRRSVRYNVMSDICPECMEVFNE